jgi:hypothetical protein
MGLADDEGNERKIPRVNLTRSLSDAIRDMTRIVERGERVLQELCAIERALSDGSSARARRRSGPKPPAPTGPPPAVQNLRLVRTGTGAAEASFNGGKVIALPPTVAELIAILASDTRPSTDEFIAFKSFDEVGDRLEKRFGRKFKHHNVSQVLTRLRNEFRKSDLDARLIESSPSKGVRLRLKRCPANHCAP